MSEVPAAAGPAPELFALRRGAPVSLRPTGVRHPRSLRFGGEVFTPYTELTHVVLGPRSLRIASRSGVFQLPRDAFQQPADAARLAGALRGRVAALPDGDARLAAMERLDDRLASPPRPRVSRALVIACAVVFALQKTFEPEFELGGMFSAPLVRAGEWWRMVTANFLHGGLAHLALNGFGLLVLGALAEVSLGSAAFAFVAAASALGAMGGSLWAGYAHAVGASGILAGVAGALLWLEFRRPAALPAPWRLPRWLLAGAVVADSVLLAFVPGVAHAAHAGGFVAGALAAAAVDPGADGTRRRPSWLPAVDSAAAGAALLAVLALGWAVWSPGDRALAERADRLLALPDLPADVLNNQAWLIAVSGDPGPEALEAAERLAERAVERTGRRDPNLLDTLAEVYFAAGEAERAVAVIDEAIALAPEERYFREQRRRFTGERAADDRPDPPAPREPGPAPLPAPEEPPGIRV